MAVFVKQLYYLLLSYLTCWLFASSQSLDTSRADLFAFTGDNISILCNARVPFLSADWVRTLSGENEEKEICLNTGICPNGYAKRYTVDMTKNFTLTIRNVTVKDTGEYTCVAYDDYTYHRYTTWLNVKDRPAQTGTVTTTEPYSTSMNDYTQQEQGESSIFIVIIGIALAVAVGLVIVVSIVAVIKLKDSGKSWCTLFTIKRPSDINAIVECGNPRSDRNNGVTDAAPHNVSVSTYRTDVVTSDTCDVPTYCTKVLKDIDVDSIKALLDDEKDKEDVNGHCGPDAKPEEAKATAFMSVDQENRLLLIATLKVFRRFYNGQNEIFAATKSFELLANTTALWLNKLTEKNAAKRRVRRLLYYECSGYCGDPIHLSRLQFSPTNHSVMGVAALDGKVYAVYQQSNKVRAGPIVGDEIVVCGMMSPVDIVACKSDQSLYIADEQLNCIWRVPIGGKFVRWQELNELVPKALSLRNGALLVTASSNVLVKISRSGKRLDRIDLYDLQPLHAVETSVSTFVVCCKLARGSQVVEVGLDGREIRRFVCVLPMLRLPIYLVLDQAGRLLVADSSNNRILLLDSQLKHGCVILNHQRDGIVEPHRLCLDENTGRLMVAHHNSNCVQTLDVKTDRRPASSA